MLSSLKGPDVDTVPGIGTYGPSFQPSAGYVPFPFDPNLDFYYPPLDFFDPLEPELEDELSDDDDIMLLVVGDLFQRLIVTNDKDYRYAVVRLCLGKSIAFDR